MVSEVIFPKKISTPAPQICLRAFSGTGAIVPVSWPSLHYWLFLHFVSLLLSWESTFVLCYRSMTQEFNCWSDWCVKIPVDRIFIAYKFNHAFVQKPLVFMDSVSSCGKWETFVFVSKLFVTLNMIYWWLSLSRDISVQFGVPLISDISSSGPVMNSRLVLSTKKSLMRTLCCHSGRERSLAR
jgi:hypothetical protein